MAEPIFHLPDLGEGLPDAEIVQWHVAEGDTVVQDQPLVSVETEKAVVEVPSPRPGRIAKLHARTGDIVEVGQPLVEFAAGEAEQRKDAGTVVGTVEEGEERLEESGPRRAAPEGIRATPAVRALARRLDVDLAQVSPSGRDGAISSEDVQRAARTLREMGQLEPLRGPRRAMARNMASAHREVAAVTLCDDACIDAWPAGSDLTIRLLRALVAGCRAEPSLNAWYDSQELGRRIIPRIDVAIAVDTADGLFVPVLRDAGNRSAEELRAGLEQMKTDIRARAVPPDEMRGYTITLSNFGTFCGRYATPIVQPPSVAILGAGRARDEIVAVDGQPQLRRILPLSLSFDHRAVTGGEAARFLAAVIADLECAN